MLRGPRCLFPLLLRCSSTFLFFCLHYVFSQLSHFKNSDIVFFLSSFPSTEQLLYITCAKYRQVLQKYLSCTTQGGGEWRKAGETTKHKCVAATHHLTSMRKGQNGEGLFKIDPSTKNRGTSFPPAKKGPFSLLFPHKTLVVSFSPPPARQRERERDQKEGLLLLLPGCKSAFSLLLPPRPARSQPGTVSVVRPRPPSASATLSACLVCSIVLHLRPRKERERERESKEE